MSNSTQSLTCFNCGNSEETVPMVRIRFAGYETWICSQCMPVIIHQTEELMDKLNAAREQAQTTQSEM
ncbi:MAG: hypothetical protein KDJ52_22990 [Anaerolineae bacterium]|nr:hypothetical protein [Anaerolineae bacterium]